MKLHRFCHLAGLVLALLCLQSGIRAAGDSAAPGAAGTPPPPEPPTQGAPGPTQPANPSPAPDTAPAPSGVKPDGAAGSNGANPDGAGAPSGAKPDAVSRQPQVATEPPKPAAQATSPFKIGAEVFTGGSNVQGHHFLDDGFWAGSAPFLPSVGYVRYDDGKGHAAKAAIGLGDLFRGKDKVWDQPAEAWWQFPAGKLSMTVGQYWVPFAAQESNQQRATARLKVIVPLSVFLIFVLLFWAFRSVKNALLVLLIGFAVACTFAVVLTIQSVRWARLTAKERSAYSGNADSRSFTSRVPRSAATCTSAFQARLLGRT